MYRRGERIFKKISRCSLTALALALNFLRISLAVSHRLAKSRRIADRLERDLVARMKRGHRCCSVN